MRRKLAVILASDVADYSRLVALDESTAIARFTKLKAALVELVGAFHGRIFNTAGDAILAEFDSATDAVRCAMEFQETVRARNLAFPESQRMLFRIGIAIGDVIVQDEDGDLLGDGVNIAARLQGMAQPGGVCLSQDVYSYVERNLSCEVVDLGQQNLKNMTRPIRVFSIPAAGSPAAEPAAALTARQDATKAAQGASPVPELHASRAATAEQPAPPRRRFSPLGASLGLLLLLGGAGWLYLNRAPATPPAAPPAPPAAPQQQAAIPPEAPPPPPEVQTPPAPPPPTPAELLAETLRTVSLPASADPLKLATDYLADEDYKGFAIAPGLGVWRGRRFVSTEDAQTVSLEACQLNFGKPCVLVALGSEALPDTADLRRTPQFMPRVIYTGPFDNGRIPILGPAARVRPDVKDYAQINQPKAMAIHPLGRVSVATGSTAQEAEAKALLACDNQGSAAVEGPCRTYAIDNQVVLPQRRALAR